MIRVMYDSDRLTDIPHNAPIGASYADLVTPADMAEYAAAGRVLVVIDRKLGDPHNLASVIDIEPGIYDPSEAPGWYDKKRQSHVPFLTTYCDRSLMGAVQAAMGNSRPHWRWITTLDGTMFVSGMPATVRPAAIQFAGENMVGLHADCSLVFENGWHPQP